MNTDELWALIHAAWDDGRDPLQDNALQDHLLEHPEHLALIETAADALAPVHAVLARPSAASPAPAPIVAQAVWSGRWAAAALLATVLGSGALAVLRSPAQAVPPRAWVRAISFSVTRTRLASGQQGRTTFTGFSAASDPAADDPHRLTRSRTWMLHSSR